MISNCTEFVDVKLRTNEKKILNTLNKDKDKITIRYLKNTLKIESTFLTINKMNLENIYVFMHRFPMEGKIKTREMKVNW